MASSCSSSYLSSQETSNFARICRIVVDVLRDVLWQVLTHEVPPAYLPNRVQTNQNKLRKLDVKINTWLLGISPSSPEIPIAEKFDVSSLYTLIRNLCSTVPTPSTQWGHTPPPGGTTLGDDIERVREFRNTLFGHATQAKIDTTDFNNICTDIKDVVSRFDVYFSSTSQAMKCNFKSEIDTILTCCMDKTLEDAYIDRMKEIAILSDDFDDVKQQVGDVKQQVDIVIQQVGDTSKKVDIVNQQVGDTNKKVDIVNQQVGDTNKKVDIVNQQVVDTNKKVDVVNQQVGDTNKKVDIVNQQVGDTNKKVDIVNQQVGDTNKKVDVVNQQVGDTNKKVDIVNQQVGDTSKKVDIVNQQVGDTNRKVDIVNQQVGDTNKKVDIVNQQVGDTSKKVDIVNQQVGDTSKKVDIVNQQVGDTNKKVDIVNQQVGDTNKKVDIVNQQVGDTNKKVDIVNQQVGDTNKKVDIVNQQVGDTDKKVDIVNQQVGDTSKKVDIVNQQVGDIKQQVDDINKNLEILQSKVDVVNKECIETAKQEDIEDLRKRWHKTDADIAEIKEALKMNPDIVEKSRIGGQEDLQTKEFGLVIDQSNQPISLETIPSQSSQVGEQMQGVEMEASQIVEHYDDPEADTQEPVIPVEIMQMDEGSIQMFKEALRDRTVKVYNIRVMIVGQYGVGKTTLCKRLLGDDVDINERKSTDGIDVHVQRCRVSMATGEWVKQDKDAEQADKLQLYCKLLNDQGQGRDIGDEQAGYSKSMHQAETTLDVKDIQKVEPTHFGRGQKSARSSSTEADLSPFDESDLSSEDQSSDEDDKGLKASSKVMQGDKKKSFSNISKEDLNQILEESIRNADMSNNEATVKNIIQFLNENADKLVRSRDEYAPLAMWDFAGQYVYYTTHQTFLTQRAIYLLVIDLTQQATDLVNDECFFDIEGKKERQVHDLVEIWMNSIHSCASSLESCSPPVILVGTHMDKIDQDIQQEKSENIFQQIRYTYLRGRPARLHLADMDFSMDNTFKDPKIKDLQKKIVELASQQLHWGESIPGRWLLLEERLMSLKAKGIKVILYHFLEKMNQEGDVRIESKEELDLFLKFEHDIGNILYFSTEELWEWIVLEPQWLIKAMKSLITADMFILRKHPQAEREWHQFKEEGKLTQKLLDIIWSKEHDTDLHNHKELILSLMEHLNIVARPIITRPMLFMKDADKVEDFFLAPCMLRQTTPPEVISPDVKAEMETSSVLCFVFMGKFLPPPIFHRLLAVCVAKWPILKRRGMNQIFCGCGIFEIDHHYRLTLYFKSYVIFARITLVAAKHQTLDPEVCIPVRKFINDSLYKILGNLRQNLNFELFIQCRCPQSVGDSLDSLFSVEKLHNIANLTCNYHDDHSVESQSLLKYWFMNEEHPSEDTCLFVIKSTSSQ